MGNIGFYYLLIFVMVIWMAIKIGRDSTGMGIATLVCWPIAVIPLITNWGRRDSDIRLQFLVAAVASVLLINASAKMAANNPAMMVYSPDRGARIHAEDPAFAAGIERDQMRDPSAGAVTTFATISIEPMGGSRRPIASDAPSPMAAAPADELPFSAAPAQIHKVPLRELKFRRGQVRLGPAYAQLDVPEHFRFVARHQLGLLSEIRGVGVSEHTLGWIVHERVDLSSPNFWFVDVQFHPVGHLAAPANTTPPAAELQWDAQLAQARFTRGSNEKPAAQDESVARLLRHGVVLFRVPELAGDQLELGLRVARLMAARLSTDSGWSYADFAGSASEQSLQSWVDSLSAAAEPAVIAEGEEAAGKRSS